MRLANGREASAFEIQSEYLERAQRFAETNDLNEEEEKALSMWEHCMLGIEQDPLTLDEVDWVVKYHLLERYKSKHGIELGDPKAALLDLQYHDVNQTRCLLLDAKNGLVERILDDSDVELAVDQPPQTTRARLRGEFVRQAKERKRDYTVDWVHLKLNDQAQRTVLCKDPFLAEDERVDALIESCRRCCGKFSSRVVAQITEERDGLQKSALTTAQMATRWCQCAGLLKRVMKW